MDSSKVSEEKKGHNGTHSNGQTGTDARPVEKIAGSKRPNPKKTGTVSNYLAMRKASARPLPNQLGDGSYRVVRQRPTLFQDVKSLRGRGWPSSAQHTLDTC